MEGFLASEKYLSGFIHWPFYGFYSLYLLVAVYIFRHQEERGSAPIFKTGFSLPAKLLVGSSNVTLNLPCFPMIVQSMVILWNGSSFPLFSIDPADSCSHLYHLIKFTLNLKLYKSGKFGVVARLQHSTITINHKRVLLANAMSFMYCFKVLASWSALVVQQPELFQLPAKQHLLPTTKYQDGGTFDVIVSEVSQRGVQSTSNW